MNANKSVLLAPGSIFLGRYRVVDLLEPIAFGQAYEADAEASLSAAPAAIVEIAADGSVPNQSPDVPSTQPLRLEVLYELKNQDDLAAIIEKFKHQSIDPAIPPTVEFGMTPDGIVYRIMHL